MCVCACVSSAKATNEYELARKKVATFINASDSSEIVFTRNATEAINLVAYSWGLSNLNPYDEVCFLSWHLYKLASVCFVCPVKYHNFFFYLTETYLVFTGDDH